MSRRKEFPQTYAEAVAILKSRDSLIVANNTRLERIWASESIALRLHSTNVVTFHKDGRIDLETGGWNTVTTRDRINGALRPGPWSIGTERCVLYLYRRNPTDLDEYAHDRYTWTYPMTLYPNGTTSAALKPRRTHQPHTNPSCACAACAAQRSAGEYRNRWQEGRQAYVEPLVFPEDTAQEAIMPEGIGEERWSDYNRKMNALLSERRPA